ncbi:hypothetical protein ULMS_10600 [Patiriisocius marinistellae]|uniref:Uncharacterized protein n=1 Tax=Patiriisocius marinistellae TaxID=2494560 RepID=A0A5J4FWJ2_9FLAO|nr:hypothetical protein [Patiriisocius marinistellae]GEQ85552.1 hypothetical protein ULMS_10600 [Patiriisocius marinistellae]
MTLEIIVFVLAILFGIIIYWTESKSNRIYRFINHLTHNEELQMKPENRKGFFHLQPFLLRLVYITLLFVIAAVIVSFTTPINAFYVQYFVSAIVGTIIGSYIASIFLFASERTKKEALQQAFEKGKDRVEEFVDDVKDNFETETPKPQSKTETKIKDAPKKSARDRFKDKGMIK